VIEYSFKSGFRRGCSKVVEERVKEIRDPRSPPARESDTTWLEEWIDDHLPVGDRVDWEIHEHPTGTIEISSNLISMYINLQTKMMWMRNFEALSEYQEGDHQYNLHVLRDTDWIVNVLNDWVRDGYG
jgi:hypothetical protein